MADEGDKVADEKTTPEEKAPEAPTTFKVGDKEYSQEELSKLVGLGETAQEYEEKWNRPIGEFYPDYTQKSQKLAEFEKAEKERAEKELQEKASQGNLTPEEQREIALQQARELGLVTKDMFEKEVQAQVNQVIRGRELLETTNKVIADAQADGKPTTTPEKLLNYMNENGVKNPDSAYKLMFEKELDDWKSKKVNGIKEEAIKTQEESTAGGKQPPPPPAITKDNLQDAIKASLTKGGRGN